jgi:DNA-binding GntR family transcriptional regulator
MESTVRPRQLHRIVTERLRQAILNGDFAPGEWLRQKRLADELGVSQMPVREALRELAADGLVEHIPYRGVRVIAFSAQDVADLYAHRSFLEGRAARVAAGKITAAELEELRDLQAQMEASMAPVNLAEYRRLNRRFHTAIYTASRRSYLARTLYQLWSAFPMMLLGSFAETVEQALPRRDRCDVEEHRALIAALERGDGEAAECAIRQHIDAACREFVSALHCDP